MAVVEPPETREQLTRIAAVLSVSPAAFRSARSATDDGPDPVERAEVALLFRRLTAPDQRAAIVALLRALTQPGDRR